MRTLKTKLLNLTATLALGALGLSFAPPASSNAIYDANLTLSITLSSVTGENGGSHNLGDYWSVIAQEYFFDGTTSTAGDGTAHYTDSTAGNAYVDMSIGDTVVQSMSSSGGAGLGIAESSVLTELGVFAENNSLDNLVFTFNYEYLISASVDSTTRLDGDDAIAQAGVDILDDFSSVDVLQDVTADLLNGPFHDQFGGSGWFSFLLEPGGSNYISAISYTNGNAVGVAVPEPSTLLLLSVGLMGFGATRLRKIA